MLERPSRSQVSSEVYAASVDLFGGKVWMNRDQYEAYLMVASFVAWLLFAACLALFYLLGPRAWRDKMIRFFRNFDAYARSHTGEAKNEEFAKHHPNPSMDYQDAVRRKRAGRCFLKGI